MTETLAQPGYLWLFQKKINCHLQAARWSRFREGVLASLELKMELCPMAEYTAPRAPEVGIIYTAWNLPSAMSSHPHRSFFMITSESESQTRIH